MKNDIFLFASILIFAVNSLLHLFWKKHGNLTKALIMPSVLLCCLFAAKPVSWVLVGAIAASWLGDVLLEREGFNWFTAGGLAFIASHLLYALSYIPSIDFGKIPVFAVSAVAVVYCAVSVSTVLNIRKNIPKNTFLPLTLYLFANAFMNVFAFMRMLSVPGAGGIIVYAGAVLFFISDNCLFYECFHPKKPKLFLPVMAAYIAGEFMIAFGSLQF